MKKFLSVILCVLFLLASCTANEPNSDVIEHENVSVTDALGESVGNSVLTNVFRGTEVELPAEFELYGNVTPYCDTENGVITMFGQTDYGAVFVSVNTDGTVTGRRALVKGNDTITRTGAVTADAMNIICYSYDTNTTVQSYYVMRYDLANDSRTYSDDFAALFTDMSGVYSAKLAVDGDGYVYVSCGSEIVVLDPTLQYSFTVMSDTWITSLTSSDKVYVSGYYDTVMIDRDTRSIVEPAGLPKKITVARSFKNSDYDLYYKTDDGLHGFNFAENGSDNTEDVLLFDWQNSDLFSDNVNITGVIDNDCVVMLNDDETSVTVYKRTDDIDLSNITVLEIAYAYSLSPAMSAKIVKFNKENKSVRVITKDYSVYSSDADSHAGATKLINDMLNGIYTPDIVVGSSAYESVFTKIIENGLYTDLYTFTENDPDINSDDILCCVRRMCESADGKLAMLPGHFSVMMTLVAPKSLVGERTSWTLTEMLDFIESLPEDVLLLENLTQENASTALFGNIGYGMFIDTENGTCDFESDEFLRYLRILKTFPDGGDAYSIGSSTTSRRDEYLSGGIALKSHYFFNSASYGWMNMYAIFGTEDIVPIGYASTDDEIGNAMTSFMPYVITSGCEHPAEAWEFLKSVILSYSADSRTYPILRSRLAEILSEDYGTYYEIYADGTIRSFPKDIKYNADGETQKPGFRMLFDEAEAEKIIDWLDNKIGLPAHESISTEVSDIINEEISSYVGGVRSAEDCAKIIQSRVGIWLAEHE